MIKDISRHTGIAESDLLLWGGLGILAYILYSGGIGGAAEAAAKALTSAAGNAATGVVKGTVSGVGEVFGLPTTSQTTTDPYVARYIIDYPTGGYVVASEWAGAGALVQAIRLPEGSGTPPPQGSALAQRFPPYVDMGGSGGVFD